MNKSVIFTSALIFATATMSPAMAADDSKKTEDTVAMTEAVEKAKDSEAVEQVKEMKTDAPTEDMKNAKDAMVEEPEAPEKNPAKE